MKLKKALIFDPYLDTLGGGERYSLTFAQVIRDLGFETHLAWSDNSILSKAEVRFGLNLNRLIIYPEAFQKLNHKSDLLTRYHLTSQYDLIFYLSDGSLPFLFGKKNLIHFQVPFIKIGGNYISNQAKLKLIHRIIYNSDFTQDVLERSLPHQKGFVLYPPVATTDFVPASKKENIIISVGRFDSPSHSKRQDVLIDAFKQLPLPIQAKFQLVLAGGHLGNQTQIDSLKEMAKGYSVKFIINPNFNELKRLYSIAKIYWHAAGFEVDEEKNPEKVEHFGITTVEAMASGCVPIVINKGGQKEIIISGTGYLCDSIDDLVINTVETIKSESIMKIICQQALKRSQEFGTEVFLRKIEQILN
jgi:glycosyltransferase involved in cell wall biosynthesis